MLNAFCILRRAGIRWPARRLRLDNRDTPSFARGHGPDTGYPLPCLSVRIKPFTTLSRQEKQDREAMTSRKSSLNGIGMEALRFDSCKSTK